MLFKEIKNAGQDEDTMYQRLGHGSFNTRLDNIMIWLSKNNYHLKKEALYMNSTSPMINITINEPVDPIHLMTLMKDAIEAEYNEYDIMEETDITYEIYFFFNNEIVSTFIMEFLQNQIYGSFLFKFKMGISDAEKNKWVLSNMCN